MTGLVAEQDFPILEADAGDARAMSIGVPEVMHAHARARLESRRAAPVECLGVSLVGPTASGLPPCALLSKPDVAGVVPVGLEVSHYRWHRLGNS